MKGKLLLIVIFLLSNVTFAQSVGTYKAKKAETVKEKVVKPKKVISAKRRGFFIMPELGMELTEGPELIIDCLMGYEFNNYFAVGVGVGCNFSFVTGVNGIVPVFVRGDLTNKSILKTKKGKETVPYYSLKMHWYSGDVLDDFYGCGSYYISPEFGIRINRSCIGVGVGLLYRYYNDLGIYNTYTGVSLKYSYNIGL